MTIHEMRTAAKMTIRAMSEYLHIPYRTIQSWDTGERTYPEYIAQLIEFKMRAEDKL